MEKKNQQLNKKIDFLLKYFPARIKNVGEDAVAARELIWGFKDCVQGVDIKVAEMIAHRIVEEYGSQLENLVLACVPTSKKSDYVSRFKLFSEKVCEVAGIENGFAHVVIMKSRPAVHEHRRGKNKCDVAPSIVDYDTKFFKGKNVLVFDDVITTGSSFSTFATQLEEIGANVVGGMFLGKTFYKYS